MRCGALLYRHIPNTLSRSLALYMTALMLWFMANLFPFLGLKVGGIYQENLLLTGGLALYEYGMGELGLVVFLTGILFPFLTIAGTLYLLVCVAMEIAPPGAGRVFGMVKRLEPWSLISVFMLGTLIAIVKLEDLAQVVPGFSSFTIANMVRITAAPKKLAPIPGVTLASNPRLTSPANSPTRNTSTMDHEPIASVNRYKRVLSLGFQVE